MAAVGSVTNQFKPQVRPLANFHPDVWEDHFLNYCTESKELRARKVEEHNMLKDELRRELHIQVGKPMEYLKLVDVFERLGVSYHFEEEIEENLRLIYDANQESVQKEKELDLYHTSLQFRIFRQHGYFIASDVFKKFMDEHGNFLESLKDDAASLLCLYEAAHVRVKGEDILEKAVGFTKIHLKDLATQPSHPLAAPIARALKYPNQMGVIRLESRHYIQFYEQDPCHDERVLKFAKLDFDLLQSLYKEELKELTKWMKYHNIAEKFPFSRMRLVEAHFFSVGIHFQPQFSVSRKIYTKAFILETILDDIYDVFGTMGELEIFTEAIERGEEDTINQLPHYMKECYKLMNDTFEEFEEDLIRLGRQNYVDCVRREVITLTKSYLQEAKWRAVKYFPTYEEYVEMVLVSSGITFIMYVSLLDNDIEESIAKKSFEVISMYGKPHKAACIIGKFMNDMTDYEWDKEKQHVGGIVDCYMKQFGVSEEDACAAINGVVEDYWKDITEEVFRPTTPIPMTLMTRIHNFCRMCDYVYKYDNSYTSTTQRLKATLSLLFVEPIF